MKRFALLCLLLLGAATGGAPAVADARGKESPDAPSASARMTACESSLDQDERYLVAEGRMRRIPGAARLQMRFGLEVRTPDRPSWTAVPAPGFGTWLTADPAPRRYTYAKRVERLSAPASYRMVVRFRWLASDGTRLATARRVSPTCRQRDLRPDLSPLGLVVERTADPATRRYVLTVANAGGTAAGPFAVELAADGKRQPALTVDSLAPGAKTELSFIAAPCRPGSILSVVVDSGATVDERNEADNELSRPCSEG